MPLPDDGTTQPLPAPLAAAVLDHVPVAVYVFAGARLRYLNPAAGAQRDRIASLHGIQITVLLRDQVRHLAAAEREPDTVVLLTAPSSEAYSVHIAALADAGQTAHVVTVRELGSNRESFARRYALSAREQEVVDLVMRGYSNRDIASALGCSEATAKKHLTHVFDKVGVDSRTQLVSRLV